MAIFRFQALRWPAPRPIAGRRPTDEEVDHAVTVPAGCHPGARPGPRGRRAHAHTAALLPRARDPRRTARPDLRAAQVPPRAARLPAPRRATHGPRRLQPRALRGRTLT